MRKAHCRRLLTSGGNGDSARLGNTALSDADVTVKLNKRDGRAVWTFDIVGKVRALVFRQPRIDLLTNRVLLVIASPLFMTLPYTLSPLGDKRSSQNPCARHPT